MWLTGPVAPRHVGSSQTRARTRVPCTGRQTLNHCATREAPRNEGFFFLPLTPGMWCVFQHHLSSSLTPTRCPAIQFNSNIDTRSYCQTSQIKGAVPQDCLHFTSSGSPGYVPDLATQSGFPTTPLLRFNNLREQFTELQRMLYLLLQFIVKDINEQPDEEVHSMRSQSPE